MQVLVEAVVPDLGGKKRRARVIIPRPQGKIQYRAKGTGNFLGSAPKFTK
jgi:hypothetical protein